MKVYAKVRKDANSGLVVGHNESIQKAIYGFGKLGCEVVPYSSFDEIYDQLTKDDVVVDYIQQSQNALAKFAVFDSHVEDYPECLKPFLGRKVWKDTINSIAMDENKWSAGSFVKPIKSKAFTGKVISSIKDLIGCGAYNEDYEVLCSEAVEFICEWRCFVYYDHILDIRPYKGDWHVNYDASRVDQMLDAFKTWEHRPVACSMDIGVTKEGKTLFIECNDGYSLGAYGLVDFDYAKFLTARWFQLLNQPDPFHPQKVVKAECPNKYFIDNQQRQAKTDYLEFYPGKMKSESFFWDEKSILINEDVFDGIGMGAFFDKHLKNFDFYGITYVPVKEWNILVGLAKYENKIVQEGMRELAEWVNEAFKENPGFTIVGI